MTEKLLPDGSYLSKIYEMLNRIEFAARLFNRSFPHDRRGDVLSKRRTGSH